MPKSPRIPVVAALAACVSLLCACNEDEPAVYEPESGTWDYAVTSTVSNSCNDDAVLQSMMTFLLDYDGGDSFQIENDADDIACEIDGTAFTCSEWTASSDVEGIDATLTWTRTWEGDFLSSTEAEGNEITRLACAGEDCNVVALVQTVPCTTNVTFEATAHE